MNLKRIYIFLIIIGAVIVLTSVIDFLQGKGFNAIPFGGGFIIIAAVFILAILIIAADPNSAYSQETRNCKLRIKN